MSDSPIVEEVRRRAMEISEQFGHDLDRYVEHLREYQQQFGDRLVSQITVVPARAKDPKSSSGGEAA